MRAIDSQTSTATTGTQPANPSATGNQGAPAADSASAGGTPAGTDVAVDLSPAAQLIARLLPGQSNGNSDLDSFMQILQQQIRSQGTDAAVLGEMPEGASPDRIQLAKQAANHLLVSYYHDDSRYADASTQDPFANLDSDSLTRNDSRYADASTQDPFANLDSDSLTRNDSRYADASTQDPFANLDSDSLTRIASDDSGTFTSAERQLAYFEGAQRGTDAANVAFSGLSPQDQGAASWNWAPAATEDAGILGTLNPGMPDWHPNQLSSQLINGLSPGGVATAAAQETAQLSAPTFNISTGADGAPQWTVLPADGQGAGASIALDGSILTQMTGTTTAPALSLYRQIAAFG
ncbi:hypothetical protein APT59_04775 [Pseudomonas oryzihabitans]|uniref:Uncharacterized protein n=1 Tax=Pseudomonas oryzihabitans TaxID=47885 RepID=A0A0U4WGV7_9PSED|nr:hypothetical protein [Pseudomonas oryzihabitans]ALZ83548.1 hypothetical protein APT59_04775 [Pseudomonas oryzihabitans]